MTKNILIAGGSGLIGTELTKSLEKKGHQVSILSRTPEKVTHVKAFAWNVDQGSVQQDAFEEIEILINLTGAPIDKSRWTPGRKKILRDSRVRSTEVLFDHLQKQGHQLELYTGSSAIGYYGNRGREILTEASGAGPDSFMVSLCKEWENAHRQLTSVADRVCILRTGLVLSAKGGLLKRFSQTVLLGSSGYLGDGHQYMSWIHIEDLVAIFGHLLDKTKVEGVINATSPAPVTNKEFMHTLIRQKRGLHLLVPVPAFALRLFLGELADSVLESSRAVPRRIQEADYQFEYESLEQALQDLI